MRSTLFWPASGGQRLVPCARRHRLRTVMRRGAAEDDEIEQRIRAEAVGTVHRNAGGFADRHQAGHDDSGSPSFSVTTSPV